jgi:hypothetical protein
MRKLRVSIFLVIATLFLLLPILGPTQRVKAGFFEEIYTVWYTCLAGPPCQGNECIVGEWTLNCDSTLTGWGWEPGHECTITRTRYGNECYFVP